MSNYNTISDALFGGFTNRIKRLERILTRGNICVQRMGRHLVNFNHEGD